MKHYLRKLGAVREWDVQTFGRVEFDSNVLESAAPRPRIARAETRAGTRPWGGAETSLYSGRCCRPGIVE